MAKKEGYLTTRGERVSYGTYFVGQNIFYITLLTFLTVFFTDVGIPALTVAAIMLVVKVWDAINDPIFGAIVDKVRFKSGKFLPWLRVSLVAIPLATIFLFAIPTGLGMTAKVIWAVIGYMLWDTAYTICDVPIFGIVTTMTNNTSERTSLMAIGRVSAMLAAIAVGIAVPQARKAIGGWLPTIILLSVVALVLMFPICITAKERIKPQHAEQEMGLKKMFGFVIRNKYMLIFFAAYIIYGATAISTGLGMYVARYLLGNEGMMTISMLITLLPSVIIGIFIPTITRKIDKFKLYFYSMMAYGILCIISYFVGYGNLVIYFVMLVIRSIPFGAITVLTFMFTPDCAEYGLYKTGVPATGVSFSMQTFTTKLNAALATSIGALALSMIGFIEGEGAAQPAGFNDKLWFINILVPAIGTLLSLLVFSRYKLRDKYVQVMAKYNAGEITREEAEARLDGKF